MDKCRSLGWSGHISRIEESVIAFKVLKNKPTGNRPPGMPTCL